MTPKVLLILAALLLGFAAGWAVQGLRMDAELARCEARSDKVRADQADAALHSLQASVGAVAAAASQVQAAGQAAAIATDAARRRLQAHQQAAPLPVDCRRDEARQQAIREAVERAQEVR